MRTLVLVIIVLAATLAANAQTEVRVDTIVKTVYYSDHSKHGAFGGDAYHKYTSQKVIKDGKTYNVVTGEKINQAGFAISGDLGYEFGQGVLGSVDARWRLKHAPEFRLELGFGQKKLGDLEYSSTRLMVGVEFNLAKDHFIDPYIGVKGGFQYFHKVTGFKTPDGDDAKWRAFCLSGEGFVGVKFGGPKVHWKPFVEAYAITGDPNEKVGLFNTVDFGVKVGVIYNFY